MSSEPSSGGTRQRGRPAGALDVAAVADYVRAREAEGAALKSAVLEYAAISRGLDVRRWDETLITVDLDAGPIPFVNMNGPSCSVASRGFCDQKQLTSACLQRAGVSVARNRAFRLAEKAEASAFAHQIGAPLVVKPNSAARGRGVTLGIYDMDGFWRAWRVAAKVVAKRPGGHIVVEQHVYGDDYRCFVVDDRVVAMTRRLRANVVGNGRDSVARLIEAKNRLRARNPYLSRYPISDEIEELDALRDSGHRLDYVPAAGTRVTLRGTSNLATGGDSIDVTDVAHQSYREIVVRAIEAIPGLHYGGVDLLARDITAPATPENHVVSEVEYAPGPGPLFPVEGTPRDVGGAVLEFYLPRSDRASAV